MKRIALRCVLLALCSVTLGSCQPKKKKHKPRNEPSFFEQLNRDVARARREAAENKRTLKTLLDHK